MKLLIASLALAHVGSAAARNNLSRTPPMGWMSWEIFRCNVDCKAEPANCISERLYKEQADAIVSQGFVTVGYDSIHMDDCWERKVPKRDLKTGRLVGDPIRFPSGMKSLGDYYHSKGVKYALYTAESATTCGGYPASANHEMLDAQTFADWGVDYMKVDGCGPADYYDHGYQAMGAALEATGRPIEYSCSWPAYINGGNETLQPFAKFIDYGCNGWRNWDDIQCNSHSLMSIIDHWGEYGKALQPFAGPGHWHDMDMLLIGNGCITPEEEQTQMAIWCISASPLIMGNDMRNVSAASKAILMNKDAIAVSQDPLGQMGIRLSNNSATQIWARVLANGDIAVALYNKGQDGPGKQPPIQPCKAGMEWTHVTGGYYEATGGAAGNAGTFSGKTPAQAEAECCANPECAGFDYNNGGGFFKKNAMAGFTNDASYQGFYKPGQVVKPPPPSANAADITVHFSMLDLHGKVSVYDIWQQKTVGAFTGSFTATAVPFHGSAFLRLSAA